VFFRQVLYRDLGCASYFIADGGEAIVVDPRLDIEVYLELAAQEKVRIAHVIDTHDHADHISGRARLASRTGARAHRPFRQEDPRDEDLLPGSLLQVGNVRLRAIATPGHRPEHLALAVTDESRASDPWMLLTGDSLLVGDLARPDLAVDPEAGARALHGSLRDLIALGEHIEVWPAHVGGSLCGGAGLSGKTSSTLGYELRTNPMLSLPERAFAEALTADVPARPPNVAQMVQANRLGGIEAPKDPAVLSPGELAEALRQEVTILDGRDPAAFDAGHLAGALNLPAGAPGLGTRAGWALRPDEAILIAAADARQADAMARALQAVGLSRILGIALDWNGLPTASDRSLTVEQLAAGLKEWAVALVDVRDAPEWRQGHVAGSTHLPLGRLGNGRELQAPAGEGPIAVACAAGARAAFAASLLRRGGWSDVVRVSGGGVGNLAAHGIPLIGEPA
jgi:hydroxyacylglutathione hydrolase